MIASLLAVMGSSSCSKEAASSAVVSGKVTLAGAPLAAGTVLFMTDAGDAAAAELGPEGAYTLNCRPGRFKIAVTPPPPVDPLTVPAGSAPPTSKQPAIPRRYHDFGTSGLAFEVQPGNNQFNIELTK